MEGVEIWTSIKSGDCSRLESIMWDCSINYHHIILLTEKHFTPELCQPYPFLRSARCRWIPRNVSPLDPPLILFPQYVFFKYRTTWNPENYILFNMPLVHDKLSKFHALQLAQYIFEFGQNYSHSQIWKIICNYS